MAEAYSIPQSPPRILAPVSATLGKAATNTGRGHLFQRVSRSRPHISKIRGHGRDVLGRTPQSALSHLSARPVSPGATVNWTGRPGMGTVAHLPRVIHHS